MIAYSLTRTSRNQPTYQPNKPGCHLASLTLLTQTKRLLEGWEKNLPPPRPSPSVPTGSMFEEPEEPVKLDVCCARRPFREESLWFRGIGSRFFFTLLLLLLVAVLMLPPPPLPPPAVWLLLLLLLLLLFVDFRL